MSRSKSEEGPAARSFPPWAGLYSRGRKSGQVWVRTPGREKAANHNGFPQPMSGGLKLLMAHDFLRTGASRRAICCQVLPLESPPVVETFGRRKLPVLPAPL